MATSFPNGHSFVQRTAGVRSALASIAPLWRPVTLLVLAIWLLAVGVRHEPWFDEAQAWLLARDNGLWSLIAHKVRYEGTPGLWHVVLWFAIRSGLPFSHFALIPTAFGLAGAAVVLWRAPFPAPLRVAIVTSYFFAYQFSIIARSYCIDLLLVPLGATFFRTRVQQPLRYGVVLGLIANTNSHGFVAAAILGAELAVRLWLADDWLRPRSIAALLLTGACGLFALWTVWQPADNNFLLPEFHRSFFKTFVLYICNAFVDHISVWSIAPPSLLDMLAGFGVSILLQRPILTLFFVSTHRILAFSLTGGLIVFSLLVYASPWHAGLLYLFWLFLLWVCWEEVSGPLRRDVAISLAIICLFQTCETLQAGIWDFKNPYSAGEPAARDIATYRAEHPQAHIAAFGYKAFEVQPWLGRNEFNNYHDGAPTPAYVRWDRHEAWSPRVTPVLWSQVLASGPDLIVASPTDRGQRYDLVSQACRAGYGIRQKISAVMTWAGSELEDESLFVFERGTAGGCHRAQS
jgi:hypothetical protein